MEVVQESIINWNDYYIANVSSPEEVNYNIHFQNCIMSFVTDNVKK